MNKGFFMNLLSKTAPVEESILAMQKVLQDVGCEVIFAQEKHPLHNCYSVNLSSKEAPSHIYSNGKGSLSHSSTASALGEYIERLQTNNFFIDFHLPNRKYYPDQVEFEFGGEYLNDALNGIYDSNNELCSDDLCDFNSDIADKIVALPFVQYSNSQMVYFPINILSNLYVSNGLASGNTPNEAKVQALSEIFERYVKFEIIKNGFALPKYPQNIIEKYPKLNNDVNFLRDAGYTVEVLDASLGGKFPVTAISLINPKNSTLFVSFGSHPILEVSLDRTMSELMQGRNLDNLDAFEIPTFDMMSVESSSNLESHFIDSNGKMGFGFLSSKKSFEYMPWKYNCVGCDEEYVMLCKIVQDCGKEIYLREYDYLGFYSCQMIVPQMSEIYPIEDLIYNNKNSGKFIRQMVLNFKTTNPQELLEALESLDDSINVGEYIGVIFKNKFTIGELKAQMYLIVGEKDEAKQYLQYSDNKIGRIIGELIDMDEQSLDFDEYKQAFCDVFSSNSTTKAVGVLAGDEYLIDTTFHSHYNNILDMYDRLDVMKRAAF